MAQQLGKMDEIGLHPALSTPYRRDHLKGFLTPAHVAEDLGHELVPVEARVVARRDEGRPHPDSSTACQACLCRAFPP